ncbi:MAG: prenyltransferase [Chloroflexi bacterium]|nr:prenyltransferase [Chloroflexota bacterium]
MKLKTYLLETRPQFLVLSLVLAFLGTAVARYNGYFDPGYAVLALAGLVLAHISVNTLNDYFDYRSGVDLATNRTPFSGGSGVLPASLLQPGEVLAIGAGSFLLAAAIGIYFTIVRGWLLLPLLLVAGLCILLYTPLILKHNWPEWSPGVGLGILPVLGAYFVQAAGYEWSALAAAVPSGILVHNLLFLNEFPDAEADKIARRKTLPLVIGKRKASLLYAALTLLVYIWIVAGVIAGWLPAFALIALLTLPLALKAIRGARRHQDMKELLPGMANNVLVVLLTQLLLGIGYLLAGIT